jgi:hypothetical protein
VLEVLAEPDPRVDGEPLGLDPREHRGLDPFPQVSVHLSHDVVVPGGLLHRLRVTPHVHQHHARTGVADDLEHRRVGAARYVVHHGRAGLERSARDLRVTGVDADREIRPGVAEPLDHRDHPADLLLERHGVRSRSGRLAADIDQVGALIGEASGVGDRILGVDEQAAVAEGVGGHVDDPHHEGAAAELERVVTAPPPTCVHGRHRSRARTRAVLRLSACRCGSSPPGGCGHRCGRAHARPRSR